MSRISSKNQITIPVEVLREAGLRPGDDVRVRPAGHGRVELERSTDWIEKWAGSMPGVWPPGEVDRLRDEWER